VSNRLYIGETRGKTLEEINWLFNHKIPARAWKNYQIPLNDEDGAEVEEVKRHELEADKVDRKSGKGFLRSRQHIEESA